jgi:hypothetical protein
MKIVVFASAFDILPCEIAGFSAAPCGVFILALRKGAG